MPNVKIHIDQADIERIKKDMRHINDGMPISVMRAINRTVTGVKTDMTAIARREYAVKAKHVRGNINVYKASKRRISGSVVSKGEPIPLIGFNVKPARPQPKRRKPYTVEVVKGQKEEIGGGAFVAVMPSGHKGVFWREKEGGKRVSRLPITERYGPRIEDLYARPEINAEISEKADERMAKELDHQVDHLFKQRMDMY